MEGGIGAAVHRAPANPDGTGTSTGAGATWQSRGVGVPEPDPISDAVDRFRRAGWSCGDFAIPAEAREAARGGLTGPMEERREEEPRAVWETLGSRYVVKDRWLTLRTDDCRNADGQLIAPYYVLEYPPWVNVLALTPEHDAVLVRQYRHGVRRIILELPGGAVDEQDACVQDAARRELR
jgi:hypothetical protein